MHRSLFSTLLNGFLCPMCHFCCFQEPENTSLLSLPTEEKSAKNDKGKHTLFAYPRYLCFPAGYVDKQQSIWCTQKAGPFTLLRRTLCRETLKESEIRSCVQAEILFCDDMISEEIFFKSHKKGTFTSASMATLWLSLPPSYFFLNSKRKSS